METSNKYYTPSIEEFHIGFEYEYRTQGNSWEKDILLYEQIHSNKLDSIRKMLQNELNEIRVKYLDKEDIESLCNEFNYKFINTYKGPQGMERYDIIDSNGTILMEYITRCMTNFSIGNINITIRNKSELKVLFQQLKI